MSSVRLVGAISTVAVMASMTAAVSALAGSTTSTATEEGALPNLVLISAQDVRPGDLVALPAVRALADEGAVFDSAGSGTPVDGPAQATLLSGQYAHSSGVSSSSGGSTGTTLANLDESETIATWLAAAGYQTSFVGTYVPGYASLSQPYRPLGWTEWHATAKSNPVSYVSPRLWGDSGLSTYAGAYASDVVGAVSADVISRRTAEDAPLFLWSSYVAPRGGTPVEPDDPSVRLHVKIATPAVRDADRDLESTATLPQSPGFDEADVSDKPLAIRSLPRLSTLRRAALTELHQQRLEALHAVDDGVAATVQALRDAGELENTLIVFTATNGVPLGEHRLVLDHNQPYAAATSVPLVIRGPGVPAGAVGHQPVDLADVPATLVRAANASPPAGRLEGRSLVETLADPAAYGDRTLPMDSGSQPLPSRRWTALRSSDWLYVERSTGEKELYDLLGDPAELVNLAGQEPTSETEAALATQLSSLRTCRGDACRGDEPARQDDRPNIVLITTDDQTVADLSTMTRTRSELVDQGTSFVNSYTPFALCCPDRATILTGQYAHNHGVLGNGGPDWPRGGFQRLDNSSTVATWLSDAGYSTAFVGKFLNGYEAVNGIPPGWDDWHAGTALHNYLRTGLFENGVQKKYPGRYQTDLLSEISTKVIERRVPDAEPLFLWISYYAPHVGESTEPDDPINVYHRELKTAQVADRHRDAFAGTPLPQDPSFNPDDVSDKPAHIRALPQISPTVIDMVQEAYQQRLESLIAVDEAVEKTVDALRSSGELDNTVIVFTSDNGYMMGQFRVEQNKVLPYEPSIRVPLVIRGPGFAAGAVRTQPTASVDLASTFAELAGATPGLTQDGLSLVGLAADPDRATNRDFVLEAGPKKRVDGPMFFTGLRTHDGWKYIEYFNGEVELYNVNVDPYELDNLAGEVPYIGAQETLRLQLATMRNCAGSACLPTSDPPTIGSEAPPSEAGR